MTFHNARILLVDDDEFCLLFTSDILKTIGLCAQTAQGGNYALDLIAQRIDSYRNGECPVLFDLIVTDFSMPQMDGPQLIEAIRTLCDHEDIRQPYITCCTSYTDDTFANRAF